MRYFVAVDPGKHACGVSIWNDTGALHWAGFVKNLDRDEVAVERVGMWQAMGRSVADVIIGTVGNNVYSLIMEIPQIYVGPKTNPNDLLDLAGVQGAIAGATMAPVEWSPLPREWKGQLPKEVSVARVEAKLSTPEKTLIEWPAKHLKHNVYDALHLGLVFLEREGLRKK